MNTAVGVVVEELLCVWSNPCNVFFCFRVCVCCHNWESLHRDNHPKPPFQIISKSLYFMHPMNSLIQRSSTNPPLKSIGTAECHFPCVLPCKKKWATKLQLSAPSVALPRGMLIFSSTGSSPGLFVRQLVQCWFKQLINRHVYSVQHVYTVYM